MKRLRILLLLTAVVSMLEYSCNNGLSEGPWYMVSGTVIDSVSGSGIESALVMADDSSYPDRLGFSDSTGSYRLFFPATHLQTVTCTKAGFVSKSLTVSATEGKWDYYGVDFKLTRDSAKGGSLDKK